MANPGKERQLILDGNLEYREKVWNDDYFRSNGFEKFGLEHAIDYHSFYSSYPNSSPLGVPKEQIEFLKKRLLSGIESEFGLNYERSGIEVFETQTSDGIIISLSVWVKIRTWEQWQLPTPEIVYEHSLVKVLQYKWNKFLAWIKKE